MPLVLGSFSCRCNCSCTILTSSKNDSARISKCAWDAITSTTNCNAFKKAELKIDLQTEEVREKLSFESLIWELNLLKIPMSVEELDVYLAMDNENSESYSESILEEVDIVQCALAIA